MSGSIAPITSPTSRTRRKTTSSCRRNMASKNGNKRLCLLEGLKDGASANELRLRVLFESRVGLGNWCKHEFEPDNSELRHWSAWDIHIKSIWMVSRKWNHIYSLWIYPDEPIQVIFSFHRFGRYLSSESFDVHSPSLSLSLSIYMIAAPDWKQS